MILVKLKQILVNEDRDMERTLKEFGRFHFRLRQSLRYVLVPVSLGNNEP